MASYLLDTSALVKYYHAEAGRPAVVSLVEEPTNRLLISRLSLIEFHSVFARKVRTSELTAEEFQFVRRRFYADLRSRKFRIVPLEHSHQLQAILLLLRQGLSHNLRTLDALQLAVALDFHRRDPLTGFVCADAALCQVAQLEGLSVFNPES